MAKSTANNLGQKIPMPCVEDDKEAGSGAGGGGRNGDASEK